MPRIRIKLKTNISHEVFPRKLSKSELRQIQIIEKSIKLCAKEGVEALAFERIAKECGVSRHLVIHYFPNRQALVKQATEYIWASLKLFVLECVAKETGAASKLKAYISSNFDWARQNPELASFVLLFFHYASTIPKFKKINADLMQLGHIRIIGILNEGIAEGVFKKTANTSIEAKGIQLSILGFLINLQCNDLEPEDNTLEKHLCDSVLKRLLKS